MLSTIAKRVAVAALCAVVSGTLLASDLKPRILQEPVLGLRYPAAGAKLDPLPEDVRAKCRELTDDERWKGHLSIFARVESPAASYYVVGGYFERRKPGRGESRFELDERGGVIAISGAQCTAFGPAREVFDVRAFNEIPQPIVRSLAQDTAARLARALGGDDQLRRELKNQRIDMARLTPELGEAFKAYAAP